MTTQELADRAGITYRQLDTWIRNGWVEASGGVGTGQPRWFTHQEVARVVHIGRLVRLGVAPAMAARIARGDMEAKRELLEALEAA